MPGSKPAAGTGLPGISSGAPRGGRSLSCAAWADLPQGADGAQSGCSLASRVKGTPAHGLLQPEAPAMWVMEALCVDMFPKLGGNHIDLGSWDRGVLAAVAVL